jgi:hypothetical protein
LLHSGKLWHYSLKRLVREKHSSLLAGVSAPMKKKFYELGHLDDLVTKRDGVPASEVKTSGSGFSV